MDGSDQQYKLIIYRPGRSEQIFTGHTGQIRHYVLSKNQAYLLTSSDDGTIRLWDVELGIELQRFVANGPVQDLVFSSDNRFAFFSIKDDHNLRILDLQLLIARPRVTSGTPTSNPDPLTPTHVFKHQLTRLPNGDIIITDDNQSITHTFVGHSAQAVATAMSDDGRWLLSADGNGQLILWNVATREIIYSVVYSSMVSGRQITAVGFGNEEIRAFTENNTVLTWEVPFLSGDGKDQIAQVCHNANLLPLPAAELTELGLDEGDGCKALGLKDSGVAVVQPESPAEAASLTAIEAEAAADIPAGDWMTIADPRAGAGSYVTSTSATTAPLTLTFTGTGIDVIYVRSASLGSFNVEIDGEIAQLVDSSGSGHVFGERVTIRGLANTAHTLRIVPQSGLVGIDGFEIFVDEATAEATTEVTAEATPEVESFVTTGNWLLTSEGWYITANAGDSLLDYGEVLDLSDGLPRELVFRSLFSAPEFGSSLAAIQISVDNGATWALAQTVIPSPIWQEVVVDLSAYIKQAIQLRFAWFPITPDEGQAEDFWIVADTVVREQVATPEVKAESVVEVTPLVATTTLMVVSETPTVEILATTLPTLESTILNTTVVYTATDGRVWLGENGWAVSDNMISISQTDERATLSLQDMAAGGGELRFTSDFNAPPDGSAAIVEVNGQPIQALEPGTADLVIDLSAYAGQMISVRLVWYYVPPAEGATADVWTVSNMQIIAPAATLTPSATVELTSEATFESSSPEAATPMPEAIPTEPPVVEILTQEAVPQP